MLTLTGCTASVAATAPKLPPTAIPTAVPRPNAALEPLVGRMLALTTLLDQSAALIASAFVAESEQLPESAVADYADVHGRLAGARSVASLVGRPSSYGQVAALLNEALTWYSRAAADGTAQPARSQDAARHGHTVLLRAENLLRGSPEANQLATLAAEQSALALASRVRALSYPARHPRHPKAARPSATPTPAVRFVVRVRHSHRRSPAFHLPATPHPTVTPTTTPTVMPTPRPAVSSHRSSPRRVRFPLSHTRYLATLESATAAFNTASSAVKKCAAVLTGISAGRDPGGATEITKCLTGANDRLRTALARLRHARASIAHTPAAGSLAATIAGIGKARTDLVHALNDAGSINLVRTGADLAAATGSLDSAKQSLISARQVLQQTH